jgi:hypothetical protein
MTGSSVGRVLGQQLDFTCGPACTLYVLRRYGRAGLGSVDQEIQIWRESNTIFMGSGNTGCCGEGLAYSLQIRGLKVVLYTSSPELSLSFTVRNAEKRRIISLATEGLRKKARKAGVQFCSGEWPNEQLERALADGHLAMAIVRMSYRTSERTPHWIVLTRKQRSKYVIWDPYGGGEVPGTSLKMDLGESVLKRCATFHRRLFCVLVARPN